MGRRKECRNCCETKCRNTEVLFLVNNQNAMAGLADKVAALLDGVEPDPSLGPTGYPRQSKWGLATYGDYCAAACTDVNTEEFMPCEVGCNGITERRKCLHCTGNCGSQQSCYQLVQPLTTDVAKVSKALAKIAYNGGTSQCSCLFDAALGAMKNWVSWGGTACGDANPCHILCGAETPGGDGIFRTIFVVTNETCQWNYRHCSHSYLNGPMVNGQSFCQDIAIGGGSVSPQGFTGACQAGNFLYYWPPAQAAFAIWKPLCGSGSFAANCESSFNQPIVSWDVDLAGFDCAPATFNYYVRGGGCVPPCPGLPCPQAGQCTGNFFPSLFKSLQTYDCQRVPHVAQPGTGDCQFVYDDCVSHSDDSSFSCTNGVNGTYCTCGCPPFSCIYCSVMPATNQVMRLNIFVTYDLTGATPKVKATVTFYGPAYYNVDCGQDPGLSTACAINISDFSPGPCGANTVVYSAFLPKPCCNTPTPLELVLESGPSPPQMVNWPTSLIVPQQILASPVTL